MITAEQVLETREKLHREFMKILEDNQVETPEGQREALETWGRDRFHMDFDEIQPLVAELGLTHADPRNIFLIGMQIGYVLGQGDDNVD